MLFYLLKSAACLTIFMVFYKYVLEKENMHVFKRYYLLGALVLAFTIPLITFTQYVEVVTLPVVHEPLETIVHYSEKTSQPEGSNYLTLLLWSIYGIGVALFGTKFLLNLYQILFKINRNPKQKSNRIIHVLLADLITPHTFFNYIFLNRQKFEQHQIPKEVFWHEEAHAKQKHSVDVLFVELLQIIFWFNPLIYLTKHAIKMNHEFLADRAVLDRGVNTSNYQHILLAFSSNASEPFPLAIGMANAINFSSIRLKIFGKHITLFNAFGQVKKRFTVMKTHTSKQKIWLRSLVLLPILALTLYGFSEKKEIVKEVPIIETSQNKASSNLSESSEQIMYSETPQQKATAGEVAEYNKLAKHINAQPPNKTVVRLKDMKRLKALYDKMSKEQQANAEPMPNFPPPPPPISATTAKKAMRLPPPPPPNATAEQMKAYEKAVEDYKEKQNYTYMHKNKDGNYVEVLVIPDTDDYLPAPPPPAPKHKNQSQIKTGFVVVNGATLYYVENMNTKTYYNRWGYEVDKNGRKLNGNVQVNASDVIPGQYITEVYQNDKVMVEFKDIDNMNDPLKEKTAVGYGKIKGSNTKENATSSTKISNEPITVIGYGTLGESKNNRTDVLPPPPPVSPLVHVKNMAKKNALFFYEGKSVTSEEAITILEDNGSLNISTKQSNTDLPKVYITKDPITINE